MKETSSKVNCEAIVKLVVQETDGDVVFQLFKKLFVVLYDKKAEELKWNEFKTKALAFEKGSEFKARLASL